MGRVILYLGAMPGRRSYAGLFLIAMATLMFELLLSRIFSVTMWYHFAFVAVSVAMFGMTVGAILVYLLPNLFATNRVPSRMTVASLLFGITIPASFIGHLLIPFDPSTTKGLLYVAITYLVIAVPFIFSGIGVCLALTRFPSRVGRLYAADLCGAAIGCVLLVLVLEWVDGPTAVVVTAIVATAGAFLFSLDAESRRLKNISVALVVGLTCVALANSSAARRNESFLKLTSVKGRAEEHYLFEKWNSFSRVTVKGDLSSTKPPFGWGMSPTNPSNYQVRELWMEIDATAGTPITAFDGDINKVAYLRYDIINLAHHLRPNSNVLVVGIGGGRDILSALAFNQKRVVGVEINENIIGAVNQNFGDFSGHLDRNPRVIFVNDEARSYIARTTERFDIIQVSLIDTWAATAAGAFSLSENSLYTVEAWETFLQKLTPRGMLTFSRWYDQERPGEIYRLAALAREALKRSGIEDPREHILIARMMFPPEAAAIGPDGVGTVIVSREPLSAADSMAISKVAGSLGFEIMLRPERVGDPNLSILIGAAPSTLTDSYPLNLEAPTDDNPFFFNMVHLADAFNKDLFSEAGTDFNMKAVRLLGFLLVTVVILSVVFIVTPLLFKTRTAALKGSFPMLGFFLAIGLGFMLIEISQMQRLILFLGHPTYGLSVVLFSLLIASGLGSSFSQKLLGPTSRVRATYWFVALIIALVFFGAITSFVIGLFESSTTPLRIAIACLLLMPLGFLMGMAFPFGVTEAVRIGKAHLTPWLWGLNGASSVTGSVLVVAISLEYGISTSFWTGVLCYALALIAFVWSRRKEGKLEEVQYGVEITDENLSRSASV